MGWGQKHGAGYRAAWRGPDGKIQYMPGFVTEKAARNYANDQESDIRKGIYRDPKLGQIELTEWANEWFGGQDLELSTMANYRRHLEVHILPHFGHRSLAAILPEDINRWEADLIRSGCAPRSVHDYRATFATCLGDAVPHRIGFNPAERGRPRGKKAERRVQQAMSRRKAWATPLDAFFLAERLAALTGEDADFVMGVAIGWTGMRWSEAVGLAPDCVRPGLWALDWKLYELEGRFYRGRPKDGSVRTIDVPPFLDDLIATHLERRTVTRCTCDEDAEKPWCSGSEYVFLGPKGGHARRSNYGRDFFRPAADGRRPRLGGSAPQPSLPVFADMLRGWPGVPLVTAAPPEWADLAEDLASEMRNQGVVNLGQAKGRARAIAKRMDGIEQAWPFEPSSRPRRPLALPVNSRSNRADLVAYALSLKMPPREVSALSREQLLDVLVRAHRPDASQAVAWAPVMRRLTPHGLRHSHEIWMAEGRIPDVLRDQRMGHTLEDEERAPIRARSMREHYTQPTDDMRTELVELLQRLWEQTCVSRVEWERRTGLRPSVPIVDEILEPFRAAVEAATPIRRAVRIARPLEPRSATRKLAQR